MHLFTMKKEMSVLQPLMCFMGFLCPTKFQSPWYDKLYVFSGCRNWTYPLLVNFKELVQGFLIGRG